MRVTHGATTDMPSTPTSRRRSGLAPHHASPRCLTRRHLLAAAATLGAAPRLHAAPPADLSTRAGEDWPGFLGPSGNGRSSLAPLPTRWPESGPRIAWHLELGEGYGPPAVALGRAVVFDRFGPQTRLRALAAETGRLLWQQTAATDYTDMFGYDGGPRAAPVIADDAVLTYDPEGRLVCRALADGSLRWEVDTAARYHVIPNFFGVGVAPLVIDGAAGRLVVVPVGGSPPGTRPAAPDRLDTVRGLDSGLVAFDLETGAERWRASAELASYSSPMVARIGGRPRIVTWMRDRLLLVDPAQGAVLDSLRFRADELFSVNAANPVVVGSEILLSETYGPGSALVDAAGDRLRIVRTDPPGSRPARSLRSHWGTPVFHEGHLFGSSGRHAGDAQLVCVDWATGQATWHEPGLGRASLALADGHLIVLGEYGDLILARANPERYEEVARTRLRDKGSELLVPPCWAAPVIARGLLFVRGRGRIVCVDLTA